MVVYVVFVMVVNQLMSSLLLAIIVNILVCFFYSRCCWCCCSCCKAKAYVLELDCTSQHSQWFLSRERANASRGVELYATFGDMTGGGPKVKDKLIAMTKVTLVVDR